jgi:hypothetical protein
VLAPKQPIFMPLRFLVFLQPVEGGEQAFGEEFDVEARGVGLVLLRGEQVEEQGGDAVFVQDAGDVLVARAVAAAAAAVGEGDDAGGAPGDRRRAGETDFCRRG